MTFNVVMMDDTDRIEADAQLIKELGGPASLAELLGYDKEGGIQRVHNWITRGIPHRVKVERPDLFLRQIAVREPTLNQAEGR